jgi:transposase
MSQSESGSSINVEELNQLSKAELVKIILTQQKLIDLSVYNGYTVVAQQKCLAHLRRHFQRLIKTPGQYNQTIGQTFLKLIDEAFRHDRLWQNERDRPGYRAWATLFQDKIRIALEQWRDQAGYEAGKLLRNLQQKAQQWWYFLDNPEVPPDNNRAERALRLARTKRKVSGGSRSMERFKQTANLLTVVQT